MADIVINEKALQADIDEVRTRFTDTKELYKWVCSILFFRYGITPTTNRLYQLVRKGSMQTVTTALSTFWQDLRERSRIKIDHPGVPDSLINATGDLIQALWEKANVEAKTHYDAAIAEANAKVTSAEAAARDAQATTQALQSEVRVLRERTESITAEKTGLATALEDERRAHSGTTASFEAARMESASLRQDLADARRDFSAELEKARAAGSLAEERLEAAERRALAEIDRERTARAEADKLTQRLRTELASTEQAANTRIQSQATEIGELGGRLKAIEADQARREKETAELRTTAAEWESKAARAEGSLASIRERVAEFQQERTRDPIERAQDVTHGVMKDYAKIMSEWKATDTEQLMLLGIRDPKLMKAWASGDEIITPASYERASHVLHIHRNLGIVLQAPRSTEWLRRPIDAPLFKGRTAMDVMLEGKLSDVRDYLAGYTTGDFG